MKKNLVVFLLSIAILSMQACGPKSENESQQSEESEVASDPAVEAEPGASAQTTVTEAEKELQIEKDHEALAEKRKVVLEERAKAALTYKDKDGNIVYNKAEVDPSYDGGKKAMMSYLRDNLVFPQEAQDKGLEGSVFVDFVITKAGNVRDVEVTDETSLSVDQTFRDEAIRVVKSMPKWLPGRQRGENVDVKFSIPITFKIW